MDPVEEEFLLDYPIESVIGPTVKLGNMDVLRHIAASSLNDDHFTDTKSVTKDNLLKLQQDLDEESSKMVKSDIQTLLKLSRKCEDDICAALDILATTADYSKRLRNEAELRFAVGDPLMAMMCQHLDAMVTLEITVLGSATKDEDTEEDTEDRVSHPPTKKKRIEKKPQTPSGNISHKKTPQTPSSIAAGNISPKSHADYALYSIRQNKTNNCLAVIVETKMTARNSEVRPQVMGYVAAFYKSNPPPLAIIVTEKYIEVLLFPFTDAGNSQQALIATVIRMALWKTLSTHWFVHTKTLVQMLILCTLSSKFKIKIDCKDHELMRHFTRKIKESLFESVCADLLEEKDQKLEEKDQELAAMQKEKDQELAAMQKEKDAMQKEKDAMQKEKDAMQKEKDQELAAMQKEMDKLKKLPV